MKVNIKRIGSHDLPIPSRGSEDAVGYDLRAELSLIGGSITMRPHSTMVVPSGFAWEIPKGYAGFVCSRSGLSAKISVCCHNSPGLIDPDFRAAVSIIVRNDGDNPFGINHGDRLAQMVIAPVATPELIETGDLGETVRGHGGLGSTGIK